MRDLWSIKLPAGTTSVEYNADLGASISELADGSYEWAIQIRDRDGNGAALTALFEVSVL